MLLYDLALDPTCGSVRTRNLVCSLYTSLFVTICTFISVKHDIWAITQYYVSPITSDYVVPYKFLSVDYDSMGMVMLIWHVVYRISM